MARTAAAKFRRTRQRRRLDCLGVIDQSQRPTPDRQRLIERGEGAVDFLQENILIGPAGHADRVEVRPSLGLRGQASNGGLQQRGLQSSHASRDDIRIRIAVAARDLLRLRVFPPNGITDVEARTREDRRMWHQAVRDEQRRPQERSDAHRLGRRPPDGAADRELEHRPHAIDPVPYDGLRDRDAHAAIVESDDGAIKARGSSQPLMMPLELSDIPVCRKKRWKRDRSPLTGATVGSTLLVLPADRRRGGGSVASPQTEEVRCPRATQAA